ncbi:helix-turn-helix transcriptional regulator [Brevibacillus sp. H7]|uniref:helix-turn-helix transcriptional regulator n=1 Tax=Brevibacillus sp. H7 TaxID=3349138 RepID=UPI00381AD722
MEKVQRLFFILTTIQQRPGITAPELAKLAGTSVRSIYRDIRHLDECGIQIMLEGNKGYFLVDNFIQTPGQLAAEEYFAISLYPMLASPIKLKGHPFQKSFQSAMEKILTRFKVNDNLLQLSKRIRIHMEQMNPEQDVIIRYLLLTVQGVQQEATEARSSIFSVKKTIEDDVIIMNNIQTGTDEAKTWFDTFSQRGEIPLSQVDLRDKLATHLSDIGYTVRVNYELGKEKISI